MACALETFAAGARRRLRRRGTRTHAALAREATATMIEKTLSTQAAPVGTYFAPEESGGRQPVVAACATRAEEYRPRRRREEARRAQSLARAHSAEELREGDAASGRAAALKRERRGSGGERGLV